MIETKTKEEEVAQEVVEEVVEEMPIGVAEDYNKVVDAANRMGKLIDKHLDFESKLQARDLSPVSLCPEQQQSLLADAETTL